MVSYNFGSLVTVSWIRSLKPIQVHVAMLLQLDREQSSFFPQSHVWQATIYIIMQINGKKTRRDWGEGRKRTTAEL